MQHHLPHEWRPPAGFVPQARRGTGNQAYEIERVALPQPLILNQAGQQFELSGLPQRRRLEKIEELFGMLGVEGEGAQWRRAGPGANGHPRCIVSVVPRFERIELAQPIRRVPEGGEPAAGIHPELPGLGRPGE